jgi:hypothetical protein
MGLLELSNKGQKQKDGARANATNKGNESANTAARMILKHLDKIRRIAIRNYQGEQDSVVSVFQNGPFDIPFRSLICPQIGNSNLPLPQNGPSDVVCRRQLP